MKYTMRYLFLNSVIFLSMHASKQSSDGISIEAKRYLPDEVVLYAHKPITAGMIVAKGAQPISITVSNNSHEPVIISPESLMVPLTSEYAIARSFHQDNQFLSSLFLESFLLGTLINLVTLGPTIIFSPIWLCLPGSGVGTIYWWYVRSKNKEINKQFRKELFLTEQVTILPESQVSKIILLPVEAAVNKFSFRVFNQAVEPVVTFGVSA